MEVINILQTRTSELNDEENLRKTNFKKYTCKRMRGLFKMLSEKFKPQHNETILLFQCCLNSEESAQEWIDRL